jgi:hypothetical protein
MKTIILFASLFLSSSFLISCSKCYDCVETINVYDSNGNLIDQNQVHEEICTADNDEIENREANGAVCSI